MTATTATLVGRVIGILLTISVDMLAGYLMGHQFHSFIIGYVTYAVLAGLDSHSIKLNDIREELKGDN